MEDSAAASRSRNKSPSPCAAHHGSNLPSFNAGVSCLGVLQLHAGLTSRSSYPNSRWSDTQHLGFRCNLDGGPDDGSQTLGMLDVVLGYGRWNLSDHHDGNIAFACLSRDKILKCKNGYSKVSINAVEIGHDESCSTAFSNAIM
jgi:hypothetical protein